MAAKIRPAGVPATFVSVAAILALAVVGVVLLGGGKAAAVQQLSCGDTITADATLRHNLVNCPNNGIIIGADNVTLDLNYHRIDGDAAFPAAGCGPEDDCDLGVASIGHDGVTVVHGSVREFAIGVAVASFVGNARHNRVLDISSSKNDFFGIGFFGVARSVIRAGSSSRNIPPEGDGIGLFGSNHVRIVHNKIRHNPGPGIHVADSNENLIKRNVFSRNSPGILLGGDRFEADRNQIRRNRCARNSACVLVSPGTRNVIARNRISKGGEGIAIEKGHRNVVARNDIVGPRGHGVYLALNRPPIGGHDNLVRRNFVRRSGGDAFLVRREDRHSRLKRNLAVGTRRDGFDVQSRPAKLTRNEARRNRDLGIEAVRGVHDGGGNVARHNGDLRQCTNIVCN